MASCSRAFPKASSTLVSASKRGLGLSSSSIRNIMTSSRNQLRNSQLAFQATKLTTSPLPRNGYQTPINPGAPNALWLRDACQCPLCVDPSTSQKLFQTSQIPSTVRYEVIETSPEFKVKWLTDIPNFPKDHVSTFDPRTIDIYHCNRVGLVNGLGVSEEHESLRNIVWSAKDLNPEYIRFDYNDVINNDDALLFALQQLKAYGFVFFRNLSSSNLNGPKAMGTRVGRLRDTFYGETWDVKSVAQAKNIAYTHQFLGFHMDLLYFADPPGYQMLHCIKNSCKGGESIFTDSFYAAEQMRVHHNDAWKVLKDFKIGYHYRNAGEHYRYSHPVFKYRESLGRTGEKEALDVVNYSPPFQAPFVMRDGLGSALNQAKFEEFRGALEIFQRLTEKRENIFEYKLEEGEMVLFNNRRVLHARNAFEPGDGERWLKGGYMDTDVVMSKLRTLTSDVKLNVEKWRKCAPECAAVQENLGLKYTGTTLETPVNAKMDEEIASKFPGYLS